MGEALSQGIKVPRVLNYYRNNLGREVLVQERIPGKLLGQLKNGGPSQIYREIGRQLAGRKSDYKKFGWIDPLTMTGVFLSWPEFLHSFVSRYGTELLRPKVVTEAELESITRWIEGSSSIRLSQSSLVHRDLAPDNIIWGPRGAYIIDWENAILGDPLFDLAVFRAHHGVGRQWKALIEVGPAFEEETMRFYTAIVLLGIVLFHLEHGESTTAVVDRLHQELSIQRI
jgi:fructosamine-3-kinase